MPTTRQYAILPKVARAAAGSVYAISAPILTRGAPGVRFDHDVDAVSGGDVGVQVQSWDDAKKAWVYEVGFGGLSAAGHQILTYDPRPPQSGTNQRAQLPSRIRVVLVGSGTTATSSVAYTLGD